MWEFFIVDPMTNILLLLYQYLNQNFVLAIAVFTILIRLVTLPLNIRQQKSSLRMQEVQPQVRAIQQKYRDNPQKMQEEFAKIGYNPVESLTGCLPLLIQMPVLFGLFAVLRNVLGTTPQTLFELSQRVYPWLPIDLSTLLPIENSFLGFNLGQPDPTFILPILVFATMFVQQRFLSPTANKKKDDDSKNAKGKKAQKQQQDDPTAAMTQSMQYTMPIMFGFFSLQFQAGLSIYFVLSNIIGIVQGYYTKQVMDREREERAKQKKNKPQKVENNDLKASDEPEYELQTPDVIEARQSGNKKTSKGAKPTSKRKKRSAKR
ncbi:MAG: YidC/Oxa1 family membrane protein insertase [Chloroflexota bacterium]